MTGDIHDLFGGPGGWSRALQLLGLDRTHSEYAYDLEPDVIRTRRAAGLHGELADVAKVRVPAGAWRGLIASPPCPLFSNAGKRLGLHARDILIDAVPEVLDGYPRAIPDARRAIAGVIAPLLAAEHPEWDEGTLPLPGVPTASEAEADRIAYEAALVLEPARWLAPALAHDWAGPDWVAIEQVPAVAPVWAAYEKALLDAGWSAWSGVLEAADYGVPQTRQRAILIASRVRPVHRPPTTHAKGGAGGLRPWVSMAAALGWGMTERPVPTMPGVSANGGPRPLDGGSGAREAVARRRPRSSQARGVACARGRVG